MIRVPSSADRSEGPGDLLVSHCVSFLPCGWGGTFRPARCWLSRLNQGLTSVKAKGKMKLSVAFVTGMGPSDGK